MLNDECFKCSNLDSDGNGFHCMIVGGDKCTEEGECMYFDGDRASDSVVIE